MHPVSLTAHAKRDAHLAALPLPPAMHAGVIR